MCIRWVKYRAYAGAARRRIHLATVLPRPPSGHRPDGRRARQADIHMYGVSWFKHSRESNRRYPGPLLAELSIMCFVSLTDGTERRGGYE